MRWHGLMLMMGGALAVLVVVRHRTAVTTARNIVATIDDVAAVVTTSLCLASSSLCSSFSTLLHNGVPNSHTAANRVE